MRRITIPAINWDEVVGNTAIVPVKLDWPELRLTNHQMLENAYAVADGREAPHPDPSYVEIVLERQ